MLHGLVVFQEFALFMFTAAAVR